MKSILVISIMIASLFNINLANKEYTLSNQNNMYDIVMLQQGETYNNLTSKKNEIQPRADIYEWRYKMVNGKMYKRLYNCTKNVWVGDWILMK